MKTLSANNQTNIAAAFQDPIIEVEMPNISKQWSSRTKATYETRIISISSILQRVNPLGGLAEQADFSISIEQETPTQFIQDEEVDNEDVDVYIQYGTDAQIKLISGRLDRWEFSGGILTLHCIANLSLRGKLLPIEQITAENFSSFRVPDDSLGHWVPLTFGRHNRAKGILIDQTIGTGAHDGRKVKFNSAVAGQDAINDLTSGLVWAEPIKTYGQMVTISGDFTADSDGHCTIEVGAGSNTESIGLVAFVLDILPSIAEGDTGMDDPEQAIDEDFETYASATDIAGAGATATTYLRMRLPDLGFPSTVRLSPGDVFGTPTYATLSLLIDCERDPAINAGARTLETLDAAIEIVEGTYPGDAALIEDVLADGETDRDNLYELTDDINDIQFSITDYQLVIGVDTDDDGSKDQIPIANFSGRYVSIRYTEEDLNPSSETLIINEVRLHMVAVQDALYAPIYADLIGYEDDAGGTYTGAANGVIENPADLLWFVFAELLAISDLTTASFSAARSALGGYAVAGQVLEITDASVVLDRIAREGKLKLYIDLDDQFAVNAFTLAGTADDTLVQEDGDFVTEDGHAEGEILSITQTPLEELYNQFDILYAWSEARGAYDGLLTLDENTDGPIGDWLTESQSRYNETRKMTVELNWIRTEEQALSYGIYLTYMLADRKREVEWQTSWNCVDHEIGDRIRLTHVDVQACEDTTVYAGYRDGSPLTTIKAAHVDPDTSAVIKAGAKVELHEGRHQYEIHTIETMPLEGKIRFKGRQVDFSRAPLSEPV